MLSTNYETEREKKRQVYIHIDRKGKRKTEKNRHVEFRLTDRQTVTDRPMDSLTDISTDWEAEWESEGERIV